MNAFTAPRRILVSRTDRLGDALLTLPLCGLLRERFPNTEIVYLGRAYTRPFIERCAHVSAVLDWDAVRDSAPKDRAAALRDTRCDTVIHLFPNRMVAVAARHAGIARRIGTSRRWFHWLSCNTLVPLRRRDSPWHEAQLNVLAAGELLGVTDPPGLESLGAQFGLVAPPPSGAVRAMLDTQRFNFIVHPLSSGSAARWPLTRFAELINQLPIEQFNVLISGSMEERLRLREWRRSITRPVMDACGLEAGDFMALVARADGLVASPTGPLHLAAALGTRALGIYPNAESSREVRRWRPIGPRADVVTPTERCATCARLGSRCECVALLHAAPVLERVQQWQRHWQHESRVWPRKAYSALR